MVPIWERRNGEGIGFSISTFHERFDEICREHVREKKARAFAFIFHDIEEGDIQEILESRGAFARLDRLAGKNLSIFYLQSSRREAIEYFNSHFLSILGVAGEAVPPCVVFFKLEKGGIANVMIAQLNNADIINGLVELLAVINRYVEEDTTNLSTVQCLKWIKRGAQVLRLEVFRAALSKALEHMF